MHTAREHLQDENTYEDNKHRSQHPHGLWRGWEKEDHRESQGSRLCLAQFIIMQEKRTKHECGLGIRPNAFLLLLLPALFSFNPLSWFIPCEYFKLAAHREAIFRPSYVLKDGNRGWVEAPSFSPRVLTKVWCSL